MQLVRRAIFWADAKESLRQTASWKFPRPPKWVIENYLGEYMLWVSRIGSPEKEKGLQDMEVDWTSILQVSPRFDFWEAVEEQLYGECLAVAEFPGVEDYLAGRRRRQRLL